MTILSPPNMRAAMAVLHAMQVLQRSCHVPQEEAALTKREPTASIE